MRFYETTFIVNPQADDATIEGHVRAVADLITQNSGKIIHEGHLGTRRLAFEIEGLTQGYYASFIYEAESHVLPLLERHFKHNEQYVRNLTIKFRTDPRELIRELRVENNEEASRERGGGETRESRGPARSDEEEKKAEPAGDDDTETSESSDADESSQRSDEDEA